MCTVIAIIIFLGHRIETLNHLKKMFGTLKITLFFLLVSIKTYKNVFIFAHVYCEWW